MRLWPVVRHIFHPQSSNNHRPRLLHPEALLVLLLVAIAGYVGVHTLGSTQLGSVLGYASTITPTAVLNQTNQQRTSQGLAPLQLNGRLSQAAVAKAQHMFSNQYWAHYAPDGTTPWSFIQNSGYAYNAAGENLARDFLHTENMMSAWMASPTHRDNIMNGQFQEIGIAVVDGTLEGYETTLVVQLFGNPSTQVSQAEPLVPQVAAQEAVTLSESQPESQQLTQGNDSDGEPVESQNEVDENDASSPLVTPELVQQARNQPTVIQPVVAGQVAFIPFGEVERPPLFSPLQLTKAFFTAMVLVIISTLVYDTIIITDRNVVRLVGKNFGHILLFLAVAFLILFFQGGVIT